MHIRRGVLAAAFLILSASALADDDVHGVDTLGMNTAIRPGDDFYGYANGTWAASSSIPPDSTSWGRVVELREETKHRSALILEDISRLGIVQSRTSQKVGDLYASFMDQDTVETRGYSPMVLPMRKIAAIASKHQLAHALGATLRADVDPMNNTNFFTENLFGLWVGPDFNIPNRNAPYLLQGGLGLPSKSYYLTNTEGMAAIRAAYQTHIANVLALTGVTDAPARAERIMALEMAIAQTHINLADSHDVHKANNPWTRADFEAKAPGLDWKEYFEGAGLGAQQHFIVWQPGAITGISALVRSTALQTWKDYLTFHLINHNSNYLSTPFTDELFDFYGRKLSGALEQRARWKRGVDAVNIAMPDAMGMLYIRRYFPSSSKARLQEMVDTIKAAFARRIEKLDWMSPATKAQAEAKLNNLYVGIGYPDHFRDYSGLGISRGDLVGNMMRAELYEYQRNLAKLSAPVDRTEWVMSPQTVNAVNIPLQNAINFPAAYLQPPFFDPRASNAYNYGAIGATIGHEISHSFDDQGSQFDGYGRLANWWTPEDDAHFKVATTKLVQQYNAYCPFADLCVRGDQTLSENLADVAGVSAALDGWRSLGDTSSGSAGFTGEQEFFLSYAQRWRTVVHDDTLRQLLLTDGHAPAMYRPATVRNLDAWYAAFNIKPGDKLYLSPNARVKIW